MRGMMRLAIMGVPGAQGAALYFIDTFDATKAGWTGPGDVSAGALTITPELGANLFKPGRGTYDVDTEGWIRYGNNVVSHDSGQVKVEYVDNGSGAALYFSSAYDLSADLTVGAWYRLDYQMRLNAGNTAYARVLAGGTGYFGPEVTSEALQDCFIVWPATSPSANILRLLVDGTDIVWLDNLVLRRIVDYAYLRQHPADFATYSANITMPYPAQRHPAGLIFNADSDSNPQNYSVLWIYSGRVYLDNIAAGERTSIGNYAITYAADAPLSVTRHQDGTLDVAYDGVVLAADIPATGNEGLYWGPMSLHDGNTFSAASADSRGVS